MGSDSSVRVPNRRMDNLVVTQTGGEVLIYDERTFALHTLNDIAVRVWENLDDAQTLRDLTVLSGLEAETVKQSLKQLEEINLLDGALSAAARPTGSRRSFLKKAGLAAASVPIIASVTTPMASAQNSGCNPIDVEIICNVGLPSCGGDSGVPCDPGGAHSVCAQSCIAAAGGTAGAMYCTADGRCGFICTYANC